jgi:hypothetical protein
MLQCSRRKEFESLAVYTRVAFAQIAANPAYVDESGNSLLHEPAFPSEDKPGLYSLASIEEIQQLRNEIAATMAGHVSAKLELTAATAANNGAGLLIFPEYSIPSSVLATCKALSDGLEIAIVAGSHVTTQISIRDCRSAGIACADELQGRAVCPIFVPHQAPRLRQKITRSKWESSLVPGEIGEPIPLNMWGKRAFLQVAICLAWISTAQGSAKKSNSNAFLLLRKIC